MQTLESALKGHLVNALDKFLEDLQRTVNRAARLETQMIDAADKRPLLTGILRPLGNEFAELASQWRDEALQGLTDSVSEHLLELSCDLRQRLERLEHKSARSAGHNGNPSANKPARVC